STAFREGTTSHRDLATRLQKVGLEAKREKWRFRLGSKHTHVDISEASESTLTSRFSVNDRNTRISSSGATGRYSISATNLALSMSRLLMVVRSQRTRKAWLGLSPRKAPPRNRAMPTSVSARRTCAQVASLEGSNNKL